MNIKTIFVCLMVLALSAMLVSAAKPEDAGKPTAPETNEKGQNFGQCVNEAAGLKNGCYKTTKDGLATCKLSAKNQTEAKTLTKNCKKTYDSSMKTCKQDFKGKKTECKKLKHNFFQGIAADMK